MSASSENIFQVCGTQSSVNVNEETESSFDEQNNVLCILSKNCKIGAAYYNMNAKLLFYYEEIVDSAPNYLATQTIFREVNPKYVLSFGNNPDEFINTLIDAIDPSSDASTVSSTRKSLPENLWLLSMKEYSYDVCKLTVGDIKIASSTEANEQKQELLIHSLINFDYLLSIQALGALVKYLDKNWAYFDTERQALQFAYIHQVNIKDCILMDLTSFNALHVFYQYSHDASFKRGSQSANREGLSLYKLFSSHCKSKIGQIHIRNILMHPLKNINELNKRLEFISFALKNTNREFIESLQDNIKELRDINVILSKIQNGRAKSRDWFTLHKTIYHTIFVNDLSSPFWDKSDILKELNNSVSLELIRLEQSISNALDFTAPRSGRPIIKFGLDDNLDAKKLRRQDIAKYVTATANIVVNELPEYISECAVLYLPEMGHLIAIKEWEPDCNHSQLLEFGYEFMFTLNGTIHFKNAMCHELDKWLGDINAEIIAHENRIIRRLSGFVLKYSGPIRDSLKILSYIDCLLAMSKVAIEKNYVRPTLNSNNVHEIVDSRHPLMEMIVTNFEANSFYSGGTHSRMKIITGPNGSGKSIYLKQIGILIYMAHVGSYIPAASANVGIVDGIYCRMQAKESAAVRLSAFMIDISQATKSLDASKSSLVLIDEFGRGTSIEEGIALLVGILKWFLKRKEGCPHILLSTHFQQLANHIPESSIIEYLKMEHTKFEGSICFLYQILKGQSNSFAFDIATECGLNQDIIKRGLQIFQSLKNNTPIGPLNNRYAVLNNQVDDFLNIDIPELDD